MVETALVAGTILTLLLFCIQIGVLGYLQLTVDAAAFVNARENAIGYASTVAATNTANIFSHVAVSNISTVPQPAPLPTVPTDYGYNSPNATTQANSPYQRHGGSSMMEPIQQVSTVSKPGVFQKLGFALGVSGSSTEAFWQECGVHDNVANNETAACGSSSQASMFEGNYFQVGENTPPYFASFNYMAKCTDSQPWTSCSSAGNSFLALGVSTYLTDTNAGAQYTGIDGFTGSTTFSAVGCHQRAFAQLAQFFYQYANFTQLYAAYGTGVYCQLVNCGVGGGSSNFSDFSKWSAFDAGTNLAIRQVYDWDRLVAAGYPPAGYTRPNQYPLDPTGTLVAGHVPCV